MLKRFTLREQHFLLRRAHETDLKALLKLINHAFRYQDHLKGQPRITSEDLLEKIQTTTFLIIEDDEDRLIAAGYYRKSKDSRHAEFGLLTTNDTPLHNVRGLGLGSYLINEFESMAKADNYAEMRIEVMAMAPKLVEYYVRRGYQTAGFGRDFGWSSTMLMKKPIS